MPTNPPNTESDKSIDEKIDDIFWNYHSELWSIKEQDDYTNQMDTANDIQKIIDEAKSQLLAYFKTEMNKLIGEDIAEVDEPSPDKWQTFNEMERVDYVANRSTRKAINQIKAIQRESLDKWGNKK